MEFLILSLLISGVYGYQAYKHSSKAKQINQQAQNEILLEKKKFRNNIILAFVTAGLGLCVQILVETYKSNLAKCTSHTETKTTTESLKLKNSSPNPSISKNSNNDLCFGNNKLKSNWKPGQQHPKYKDLIAGTKPGVWNPKPGYEFLTDNNKCDPRVRRTK